jgi:hypothetical protein
MNGTLDVTAAKRAQSGLDAFLASMRTVPTAASPKRLPKKTRDLTSPRASTCAADQSMKLHMIG